MQDNRRTATGIREAQLTLLEVKPFLSSSFKRFGPQLAPSSNQYFHKEESWRQSPRPNKAPQTAAGMDRLVLFARPRFRSVRSSLTTLWQKEADSVGTSGALSSGLMRPQRPKRRGQCWSLYGYRRRIRFDNAVLDDVTLLYCTG